MTDRIIYIGTTPDEPIGGIRVLYEHVELLNSAGVNAVAWHPRAGMSHRWFESSAPLVCGARIKLDATDTLVIPECIVDTHDPAPGCRKIIYNQNYFLTFASVGWEQFPVWDPEPAVWVFSDVATDVMGRLRDFLPIAEVASIPLAINTELFVPDEATRRERKVVWMPRKRPREAQLLHALFAADRRFDGVTLRPLDGLPIHRVADELRSASVFVALGMHEGFGLPVAEALAAGCSVVGYSGGGGAELFDAPGAHAVADPDVLALVDRVAELLAHEPSAADRASYHSWIAKRYNATRQRDQLLRAVEAAQALPARGGIASYPLAMLDVPSLEGMRQEVAAELGHAAT